MNGEKTICLCAIVKNESKTIARLIESCKDILDYYVIVDTGSTDDTKQIIKDLMCSYKIEGEIHDRPWVNFGHNRSELMSLAYQKGSYLLLADADFEYRVNKNFDKNKLTYDWYHLRYLGDIDFSQVLLVSGDKKWRYIGVTHEYIIADGLGQSPELQDIKILHHADGGMRGDKLQRDASLLEQAILDEPDNPRNHFYLAQTYANMREYEKAASAYERRVKLGGWQEEVYYSLFQIGVMRYYLKNIPSAILQLIEAFSNRPTRFEALFMLGTIHREQKKYHIASIYFEQVLRMSYPANDKLFIHKSNKEFMADFELAICYYWMGDFKRAKDHALLVKRMLHVPEKIRKQNEQNLNFIEQKIEAAKNKHNDIIYVSMFTVGTPYEDEVKNLKESLDKFSLPYEIVGIRNQGSWVKNTQMKPQVIKSVLDKYNKDVVWIDADAVVKQKPEFFYSINCDVSYHTIHEWNEKMTGTLYFKNNNKAKEVLNKWTALNSNNDNPDAVNFQAVIESMQGISITELPVDYINVEDIQYLQSDDPVITHYQASRRFKETVNLPGGMKEYEFTVVRDELLKLKTGNDTCSIVGNGPFKSDLSKEIDESFVMRCNNFRIGPKEIGSRTDLNISSLYHEIIPAGKVDYPILGVLPISDVLYQKYTDAKGMHMFWLQNGQKLLGYGNKVLMYGDLDDYCDVFKYVVNEIQAFPTVGIMAIATARMLGFKKIIVSGFTFFQTEKSHYFLDNAVKPSSHHNPTAERELLKRWIYSDDIEYILDDLTKENLYADVPVKPNAVRV